MSGGVVAEQSDQSADQPERSYQSERARPIADLLVDALEHLPAEDRKRVTAWVLARTTRQYGWFSRDTAQPQRDRLVAGTPQAPPLRRILAERPFADPTTQETLAAQLLAGTQLKGEHQVVPVRLPAQLHTQLREWCAEHGFSMATVIRGLLTRFLEGQVTGADPSGVRADTGSSAESDVEETDHGVDEDA